MSIKSDLSVKEPSIKSVLDGKATYTIDESADSSGEFRIFTPVGKEVSSDDGVITIEEVMVNELTSKEVLIKELDVDDIDIGGGYNQKAFYMSGNSVNGSSTFNLTQLSTGVTQIKILGVQLLQTVEFNPVPGGTPPTINSWIAKWKLNDGTTISILDNMSDVLNYVGGTASRFYDSNTNSDVSAGDNYIEITLWGVSDTPVNATDTSGEIVGFIHYIEMPNLSLPIT